MRNGYFEQMTGKQSLAGSADYKAGKRALQYHETLRAIDLLRASVAASAVSERAELRMRLYWLAIALRRLGRDEMAVKALASAQKLGSRSCARRLYDHWVNGYGMPRSSCEEHDDYRAFFSIHVKRYNRATGKNHFIDTAEMEAILRIIAEAWIRLGRMRDLKGMGCSEKLRVFNETRIDFPLLSRSPGFAGIAYDRGEFPRIIPTDFRTGTVVGLDDRCTCGSGLPYRRCCGRIKVPGEY